VSETETTHILEMDAEQLCAWTKARGQPAYRADQLADWIYRKSVTDPAEMTNLPAALASAVTVLTSRVVRRAESRDKTVKLLVELADGERIETVLIPAGKRTTACVSTQAGCAMGCVFCASGLGGLRRNLTAGEIVEQVLHLQRECRRRVTNVVFMGMGEPLANFDATLSAVRAMIDPRRLGLSARHVTVSTVGLPGQIRRLAATRIPVTLAISLHAPHDALRHHLIPTAAGTTIAEIVAAAAEFYDARKREVTLEYVLLDGVNDTNVCAEALARIAAQLRCNVNLIQYNPVESLPYNRPSLDRVESFAERLTRRGVNVHVRRSRGLDATAACGQLRADNKI
jgi:23S rRNA (adenine2503-C2)-methyltransferase